MVKQEEEYHVVSQLTNPNHFICGTLWDKQRVLNAVPATSGTDPEVIRLAMRLAFEEAKRAELRRSSRELSLNRCAIEWEAKFAVGVTHLGVLDCAYPDCQPQP